MLPRLFVVFNSALSLWLTSCAKQQTAPITHVSAPAEEWVQGIGYVEPAEEVRQLAFKHPGVIAECLVNVGQKARKDQVLMRLRNIEERAAVLEAEAGLALAKAEMVQTLAGVNPARILAQEAALEAAKAEASYAKAEHDRQQRLLASGAGASSEAERDLARSELQRKEESVRQAAAELSHLKNYVRAEDRMVMEARVSQAQARLMEAQAKLEETELRAPLDGVVLEILHREGNAAHTAFPDPVIVFANLSRLRVRAEIDETYALRLKHGQSAVVATRDESHAESIGIITVVKQMMGRKTVFSNSSAERKDLDALQVLIDLQSSTVLPVGLQVDVRIDTTVPQGGNEAVVSKDRSASQTR